MIVPAWSSPLRMATGLNPALVTTPALKIIDSEIRRALITPSARLLLSMPPQEGKSTLIQNAIAWSLWLNRKRRHILVSYADDLVRRQSSAVRDLLLTHPEKLGMQLRHDTKSKTEWKITEGGGMFAVGVGGPLPGAAADVLIIDDPIKGRAEAESKAYREHLQDWWRGSASTRLAPDAPVIVIACMTGDTPVLMADGSWRSMADVRPGDQVGTYEGGKITTSRVVNWINQGPDSVYRIRMKSGIQVKANARHPFLVIENGVETWRRTSDLRPRSIILRATGGSGEESPVQPTDAIATPGPRACVHRTTTRPDGLQGTDLRQHLTPRPSGRPNSATATASNLKAMTACSLSRVGAAPSVIDSLSPRGTPRSGEVRSPLITITTPEQCEDCCATIATGLSATPAAPRYSDEPLTTWRVEADEVIEIVPAGTEDVFDLQIERTENFIAGGLVSHNTRWHEHDLHGFLLDQEDKAEWRQVNIPAQADHRPDKGESDILGREPGEYMISARGRDEKDWKRRKISAGSRDWAALFQGRPAPIKGDILKRDKWQQYPDPLWVIHADGTYWCPPSEDQEMIISVDCAFKDLKQSDYVVMQVWMRRGPNAYLLDQVRDHMDFPETCNRLVGLCAKWPQADLKLVEDKANGTAVIATLRIKVPGLVPENPTDSKISRAHAVTPFQEAGNLWLPDPMIDGCAWITEFVEEAATFPNGQHDDQVDGMTQAVRRLLVQPFIAEDETIDDPEQELLDLQGYAVSLY